MKNGFYGIVFDLDGVLVDSEPFHQRMWAQTIRQFDVDLEKNWFEGFMGTPDTETARGLIARYSLTLGWEELVGLKRDKVKYNAPEYVQPWEGVTEGLALLSGLPQAIATSSSREIAESLLDAAGLTDFFKVVITSNDVVNTKPDPQCYAEACRRLGLDPSVCLALEDSPAGIESAKRAGLYGVGVSTSYGRHQLSRADRVFPSPADAFSWLEGKVIFQQEGRDAL